MKKVLTVSEFARMGGKARAKKLTPERRREIASQAGKKGGRPRKATPSGVSPRSTSRLKLAGKV
jgi:general stress protein YciG